MFVFFVFFFLFFFVFFLFFFGGGWGWGGDGSSVIFCNSQYDDMITVASELFHSVGTVFRLLLVL